MKNTIYLAVTADVLELPLALFENINECVKWSSISKSKIYNCIYYKILDKQNKCYYVRVKLDGKQR